jgi:hypothetical protein
MGDLTVCLGKICEYYRIYYKTKEFHGASVPEFGMTNEKCNHPDFVKDTMNIQSLKICPKNKKGNNYGR